MAPICDSALSGIRVLDLSTNYAAYAGRLLADLGAEVIQVEPPDGSPLRRLAPSRSLASGETVSFAHSFLCAGKRSVTIDLSHSAGRKSFGELARSSDVIVHTPDLSRKSHLSVDDLRQKNSKLIVASITPFGLVGPYAQFVAGDLTIMAAGGLLSLGGYRGSEPIGLQGEQSQLAAGLFAAAAVMAALCAREESGQGLWIDVSAQECIAFALEDAVPEWYLNHRVRHRFGDVAREAGTGIYQCMDGYISMVAGRLGTAKAFASLARWVAESEVASAATLLETHWQDFAYRQSAGGIAAFAKIFRAFCSCRSKAQLYREGQARQIAIAPVNSIADLFDDEQLSERGFFRTQYDAAFARELAFPGPPYRLSGTPAAVQSSAPGLGQHNDALLVNEL